MNREILDLYTDYLISSFGPTTATGLSRLVNGEVSHDQVSRMLASPKMTSKDWWRKVKPEVRKIESADGVIIIDDSIEEKPYTDENEIICWHWDHAKNRSVKGINFITALYYAPTEAQSPRMSAPAICYKRFTRTRYPSNMYSPTSGLPQPRTCVL